MSLLHQPNSENSLSLLQRILFGIVALTTVIVPLFFLSTTQNALVTPRQFLLYALVLLGVFSWVLDAVFKKELFLRRSVLDIPLLFFFGSILLASLFSVASPVSFLGKMEVYVLHAISIFASIVWTVLIVQTIRTSERWFMMLQLLLLTGIIHGYLFLAQDFRLFGQALLGDRITLFSQSHISFSIFMATLLVLSLGILMIKKLSIRHKILPLLQVIIGGFVLVRVGAPLTFVLLAIGLGCLVVIGSTFLADMSKRVLVGIFTLFVVSILIVFLGVPGSLLANTPTEISLSGSASRSIAFSSLFESPKQFLIGTGPGTFVQSFSEHRNAAFNINPIAWSVRFHQPQSSLYAILSEMGMLGLIGFLIIFVSFIGTCFSAWFKVKPGAWTPLEGEEDTVDHSIHLLVFVVAAALITLSCALFVQFFDVSMWFVWWTLLGIAITGFASLVPSVVTDRRISLRVSPQYALLMSFGMVIVSTGIILVGIFGSRLFLADVSYTTALRANSLTEIDEALQKTMSYRASYPPYMLADARLSLEQAKSLVTIGDADPNEVAALLAAAVNTAKAATDKEPRNVENWDTLSTMYINTQSIVPEANAWAVQALEKAIELEPTNSVFNWQLGNVYAAAGSLELAEESYKASIRLKPNYVIAYISLSELLESQERYDQAIALYQPIFELVSQYPEALFNMGRLFYNRQNDGDFDRAKTVLGEAIVLSPNFANAHYTLGLIYEAEGDRTAALASFERVLEQNPENIELQQKVSLLRGF